MSNELFNFIRCVCSGSNNRVLEEYSKFEKNPNEIDRIRTILSAEISEDKLGELPPMLIFLLDKEKTNILSQVENNFVITSKADIETRRDSEFIEDRAAFEKNLAINLTSKYSAVQLAKILAKRINDSLDVTCPYCSEILFDPAISDCEIYCLDCENRLLNIS